MTDFESELARSGTLVYPNVGISMLPLLREHRDLMVIRKTTERLKRYDAALFKRSNGQYVLHRVMKVCPESYVFCGDNQWKKEHGVTDEQILGVLTAVIRDGKEIPVTALSYRCYVHLWCDLFPIRAGLIRMREFMGRIRRKLKHGL